MAVKDLSKKPYIEDIDENIFIGLDLPIRRSDGSEGYFASTSTTIEAVKNNIRNLLNTNQGERLMNPTLGLDLKKYLFEQITQEVIIDIEDKIHDTFRFWLPFVDIRKIRVMVTPTDGDVGVNSITINILFSINRDPNTLDSVRIILNSNGESNDTTNTSGI